MVKAFQGHFLREKYIDNGAKPEIVVHSLKLRPRRSWVYLSQSQNGYVGRWSVAKDQ